MRGRSLDTFDRGFFCPDHVLVSLREAGVWCLQQDSCEAPGNRSPPARQAPQRAVRFPPAPAFPKPSTLVCSISTASAWSEMKVPNRQACRRFLLFHPRSKASRFRLDRRFVMTARQNLCDRGCRFFHRSDYEGETFFPAESAVSRRDRRWQCGRCRDST